jgi:hypothetical protein
VDQATQDRRRREIEDEATRLFPGAVRRVEWRHHGDTPVIEPGELLPTFVLAEPRRWRRPEIRQSLKAFQHAHGPALKRFESELARRWPEIRHIGVTFEDDAGRSRGGIIQALDRAGPRYPRRGARDDPAHGGRTGSRRHAYRRGRRGQPRRRPPRALAQRPLDE